MKSLNEYLKSVREFEQNTPDRVLLELNRCTTYVDLETFDFNRRDTMPGQVMTIAKYAYRSLEAREDHIRFMKASGWSVMGATFLEVGIGAKKHKFVIAEFRRLQDLEICTGATKFLAELELDCDEIQKQVNVHANDSYTDDIQYAQVAEGNEHCEGCVTDTNYFYK